MDSSLTPHSQAASTPGFQLGAVPVSETQTRFSVWAPKAKTVSVELIRRWGHLEKVLSEHPLLRNADGIFSNVIADCPSKTLYRFKLGNNTGRPDPRSRFQPFGVHGPSQVIDPNAFQWTDQTWTGVQKRDLVIYELHIGSFTQKGTYASAIDKLDELKRLGVTAIEVLPLCQCPGNWNWGYDGVNFFAPSNTFGTPDELKAFVDACHARGLAIINDVVYNHIGPEGNYLSEFGPYRSKNFDTPWGDAFDFDRDQVRQFVIDNVLFWIDEYHFDGLRLDAVHYMFDDRDNHILTEIQERFREHESTLGRKTYLIGESNIYDPELVGDVANGNPHYDAIWSDCLMHSIYTLGNPDVRLSDRLYEVTDIAEALEHAYVFSTPQAVRVTPEIRKKNHINGDRQYIESLIMALQTHDSVGNHPHGKRLHQLTSVEYQRAAAALVLLYPSIPMLFMGEEWSTAAPFPFFADFEDHGLRRVVDKGRRDEYPHHDWAGSPLPSDPIAFTSTRSKPEDLNHVTNRWYHQLLAFRKSAIDDGWLSAANLSTRSDLEDSVFKLVYQNSVGEIHVCARLATNGGEPISLESLGIGQILLDSNCEDKTSTALGAAHCLIWFA
jgi:maltooligosyltrehalose trehalohydrolase